MGNVLKFFLGYVAFANYAYLCSSMGSRCHSQDKCTYNAAQTFPSCYCDAKCSDYMDCCREYVSNHQVGIGNSSTAHEQRCILLTNEKHLLPERIGAFMLTTCKTTGSNCTANSFSKEGLLPVSKGGMIYLNADCAICNNISDFQSWSIVFEISNADNILSLFEDEGLEQDLSNVKVLDNIFNELHIDFVKYYLQPPNGFRPRFCPFDFIHYRQPGYDENIHQNIVQCGQNRKLFKNLEKCIENGCCLSEFNSCPLLKLKHHGTDGILKSTTKGFQILLDMSSTQKDASTDGVEKSLPPTMSYIGVRVIVTLQVYGLFDGTSSVDTCVQSTIVYLISLEFKLQPVRDSYLQIMPENGKPLFAFFVRSFSQLNVAEMNSLLRLNASIHCEDTSGADHINFFMRGYNESYISTMINQRGYKRIFIRSEKYKQFSKTNVTTCFDVHLSLTKMDTGHTTVYIQCKSKEEMLATSAAQKSPYGEFFLYLMMFSLFFI